MTTQIRFFGVAAYEIITSQGKHVLLDPFLDDNPGSPVKSHDLAQVDLIIVSHAPFDHFGDTEAIARRTGAPVICGGEVKAYLIIRPVFGPISTQCNHMLPTPIYLESLWWPAYLPRIPARSMLFKTAFL